MKTVIIDKHVLRFSIFTFVSIGYRLQYTHGVSILLEKSNNKLFDLERLKSKLNRFAAQNERTRENCSSRLPKTRSSLKMKINDNYVYRIIERNINIDYSKRTLPQNLFRFFYIHTDVVNTM